MNSERLKRIKEIEGTIFRVTKLLQKLERKSLKIGWLRFSVFAAGLIFFFVPYFFSAKTFAYTGLIIFAAIFIAVSISQNRILESIVRYKKWIGIKRNNLARINLDWENIPPAKIFSFSNHEPLEIDLNITGDRSLHQLIDSAKSKEGSELLRKFLITVPDNEEEIVRRQNVIKELIKNSHFRDKFLLTSSLVESIIS